MEPGLKSQEDQPMAERWTTWPEEKWERAQSAGRSPDKGQLPVTATSWD